MEKELEELRETSKQLESRLEQEEAEARVQLRREAHLHKETNDYIVSSCLVELFGQFWSGGVG